MSKSVRITWGFCLALTMKSIRSWTWLHMQCLCYAQLFLNYFSKLFQSFHPKNWISSNDSYIMGHRIHRDFCCVKDKDLLLRARLEYLWWTITEWSQVKNSDSHLHPKIWVWTYILTQYQIQGRYLHQTDLNKSWNTDGIIFILHRKIWLVFRSMV